MGCEQVLLERHLINWGLRMDLILGMVSTGLSVGMSRCDELT